MVNGIDSLISLSEFLLLVYRNASDFCVLILYPVTLLNSLISSSNFLILSLGFPVYSMLRASTGDPTHDKVMWRGLTGKADKDSRDPLDLLEHLPPNQNLSIFLSYAFRQTLLILMGAVPDHLSLKEINLEL